MYCFNLPYRLIPWEHGNLTSRPRCRHQETDELLLELRSARRTASPAGRPPAALRLRGLWHDPLSESADRRRLRAGLRGPHPDVPPRHRAATWLLDLPR